MGNEKSQISGNTQGKEETGIPPQPVSKPGKQGHFASSDFIRDRPLFEAQYKTFWDELQKSGLHPGAFNWPRIAREQVDWALLHKKRFLSVAIEFGSMPWHVVCQLSRMEMGLNFNGSLLNGDPWNKKTVRFPAGHGPWDSWEEAAVYAIKDEARRWNFKLKDWKWDLGGTFFHLNAWNGFTHCLPEGKDIQPPYASPYIYSGTPFYQRGKRVEKKNWLGKYYGYFDKNLVSEQLGCMAFYYELNKREKLW